MFESCALLKNDDTLNQNDLLRKNPYIILKKSSLNLAGCNSSVGSDVAWESRGTLIDPRVRHIFL